MAPTQLPDPHAITTDAELEAAIGAPGERVKIKLRTEIDDTAREFIERSPFVVVATCDADGRLDASPKGDPPGFVHVIDSTTLAIPERKGNSLGFGPRNVLATGRIGLIFMVPGQREYSSGQRNGPPHTRSRAPRSARRHGQAGSDGDGRRGRGGVLPLREGDDPRRVVGATGRVGSRTHPHR